MSGKLKLNFKKSSIYIRYLKGIRGRKEGKGSMDRRQPWTEALICKALFCGSLNAVFNCLFKAMLS